MFDNGNFRTRLVGGFILICIAVIALSTAFTLKTIFEFTTAGATISGMIVFLLLYLLHSQRVLVREIAELKYNTLVPMETEDVLRSEVSALAARIDFLSPANDDILKTVGALKSAISEHEQEFNVVSDRLEHIEALAKQPGNGGHKIIPLDNTRIQSGTDNHKEYENPLEQTDMIKGDEPQNLAKGSFELFSNETKKPLAEKLVKAIELNQLELNLQPVVNLTSREPAFYETTLRFLDSDGSYIKQSLLIRCAEEEALAPALDIQTLFGSVQLLRTLDELGKRTGLLCPVSHSTLTSSRVFGDAYSFLRANTALADTLILEIDQSTLDTLGVTGRGNLNRIVDIGYSLLLNNTQHFDLDGDLLRNSGFRHLKVAINELLNISGEDNLDEQIMDFSADMAQSGIGVIVSDIQSESQAIHLVDFDLAFGQGALFASPRAVKPELLKPADEAALSKNMA